MAKNKLPDLNARVEQKATIVAQEGDVKAPVPGEQLDQEHPPVEMKEQLDEQETPELEEQEQEEVTPLAPVPEETVVPRNSLAQAIHAAQHGGDQIRRSEPFHFQIAEIEAYVEAMAPGIEQAPGVGATWQVRLYRALTGMTRLTGPDFRAGMDRALELFAAHADGALSPRLTQRWSYDMRLSKRECDNFLRLMNIMQLASNENTRARLSEFASPTKTFADFEPAEAQMFMAYFS